ncbi:MAG: hypothetical protein AB1640_06230 [bacterium]
MECRLKDSEPEAPGAREPRGRGGSPSRVVLRLVCLASTVVKKAYALGLIALVLWLSLKAFSYLVSALLLPARPPPQIADVPRRMDETVLERAAAAFAGVQATENPRSPLSHYHRFEPWFIPDQVNGCTRQGCHVPLPHGRNKADRAFLNLHVTSLHCGVCHTRVEETPLPLAWYDLKTGENRPAPASLRAYQWLMQPRVQSAPSFSAADQQEIVGLLESTAREAEGEPALSNLAEHLAAVRAQSADFRRLVALARETLPRHFRGEYGAKLALVDSRTREPRLGRTGDEDAIARFLAGRGRLGEEEEASLLKHIHPDRRDPTLHCTQCHRSEGSLVDLTTVGYPPARIAAIIQPLVMQTIEHIAEGRPFHIPSLFGMPGRGGPFE